MTKWRAKQYHISISRTKQLVITLRRFKTARVNRAKSFRQLVLPLDFASGSVREVAFRVVKHRARPATAKNFWRLQSLAPIILLALGIVGASFFGNQIVQGRQLEPAKTFSATSQLASSAAKTSKSLYRSLPTHISIPAVGIDASIISVGKNASGEIQMPPLGALHTTGWYKYSPTPGQIGPAIIVGHVDNDTTISIFWRLHEVKAGDIITINRADGSVVRFKVTELKQFSQVNFPTEEVYGNINYPGLRLITCGGTFDNQTGSYTQNTVVYAKIIN